MNSTEISDPKQTRITGIPIITNVPWGMHLCQFYQSKEDLIDILVPYFKEGLENNEFCMWITSEPLHIEEAKKALRNAIQNLDDYFKKGQIEILDSTEWYTKSGKFDADEVLSGWITKEVKARQNGFDGLRLSGNTFWLEKKDWGDFKKYEEAVNSVIRNYHMIAICSYSLEKCNASEIIDVVSNHQYALIKKDKKWQILQNSDYVQTIEKLRKSEEKYRNLFETMTQGVIYQDSEGKIFSANLAAQKILGLTFDQMQGRTSIDPHWRATHEDGSDFIGETHPSMVALHTGRIIKDTIMRVYNPKTDKHHMIKITAVPQFKQGEKKPYQVYTTFEDITEQKQMEEKVHAHNLLLETIINHIPAAVNLIRGSDMRLQLINPIYQAIAPKKSMVGKTLDELWPETGQNFTKLCQKVIETGETYQVTDELNMIRRRPNGPIEPAYFSWSLNRVPLPGEEGWGILNIAWETTERKKNEEERFRQMKILEQIRDGIIITDSDFKISYWNKGAEELFGFSSTEAVGKNSQELLQPTYKSGEREKIINDINLHGSSKTTITIKHRNGAEIFTEVHATRLLNESGKITGYVVTYRDVTDREKIQNTLKEAEQKYRTVAENTYDFEFWINPENQYLYASPSCLKLTGYEPQDFLQDSSLGNRLVHPDDKKKFQHHTSREKTGKKTEEMEFRIIRKDGKERWIHHVCQPIYDNNGSYLGIRGSNRDITDRKLTEEAFLESKNRLDFALNVSRIGAWDLDLLDHTAFRSLEHDKIFGYDKLLPQWTYEMFLEHIIPEDRPMVNEKFTHAIDSKSDWNFECRIRRTDGAIRWIWAAGRHKTEIDGSISHMAGIVQDITERKQKDEDLRRKQIELQTLFDNSPAGLVLFDATPPYTVLVHNKYYQELFAEPYRSKGMVGLNIRQYAPNTESSGVEAVFNEVVETKQPKNLLDFLYNSNPPEEYWFNWHLSPIIIDNKVVALVSMSLDVTNRHKTEEQLRETRDYLENLLNYANAPIIVWDKDFKITRFNHAFEHLTGFQSKDIIGKKLEILFPKESKKDTLQKIQRTLSGEYWESVEIPILCTDKNIRTALWNSANIYDKTGQNLLATIAQGIDITERKKAQSELLRLASFPEKNPNPIIEIDLSGKIEYLNSTSKNLFVDIEKKKFNHSFLKGIKDNIPEIQQQKNPLVREIKSGEKFYHQSITYIPENERIRIYSTDITLRKLAEEELVKSEKKYRMIVENSMYVIMVTQPDGIISYLSPSSKDLLGYIPDELVGTNPSIFHSGDEKNVQQALSRALKGEKGTGLEYRILTKQGEIRWVSHSWSPIFLDGTLQSIISVIVDITDRKSSDEKIKKLNEKLMHRSIELAIANKELETFSYSVSHDLRAPLRSIDGFSQALLEDYAGKFDKQGEEYLQRVRNATKRMEQLIDDMLRLSRLTRTEMNIETVDLGKIANEIIDELKKNDPARKYKFITQKDILADGDANLLNILLENLLGNAWKFTKKREKTEIEFGKVQQNNETIFFIRDNGAGFNMKYADKLFVPFQRLHDDTEYPGTGIGLGIVARIVHRHGGRIWAEAEENKGATFFFTLGGKANE